MSWKLLALLAACLSMPLFAQQADTASSLTPQQLEGKGRFAQRCSVCHSITGRSYGPRLSKYVVLGREAAVRRQIEEGSERMPAFKYALKPEWIDQILEYLKTVDRPGGRANNLDLPD